MVAFLINAKGENVRMTNKKNSNDTVIHEFAQAIKSERKKAQMNQLAPLLVFLVLVIFFSVAAPGFFSFNNLTAIMNQLAIPLILAIGVTFVIITGSIDLSIDGLMGLTGTMVAYFILNNTTNLNLGFFGVVLAISIGAAIGAINGIIQVRFRIPSFLLTYGMSSIAAGITLLVYRGIPIGIRDENFLRVASTSVLGLPVLMWIAIAVFIVAYTIQTYTPFGRYIYAVGSNESILKSLGIDVNRIKILVFAFSGMCIGIAGVLGAARLQRGDLLIGAHHLFPAITSVVLGGTSLLGGKGGVVNTLIGAVIIAILNNGLILLGVNPHIITGMQGTIIILAVAFSIDRRRGTLNK